MNLLHPQGQERSVLARMRHQKRSPKRLRLHDVTASVLQQQLFTIYLEPVHQPHCGNCLLFGWRTCHSFREQIKKPGTQDLSRQPFNVSFQYFSEINQLPSSKATSFYVKCPLHGTRLRSCSKQISKGTQDEIIRSLMFWVLGGGRGSDRVHQTQFPLGPLIHQIHIFFFKANQSSHQSSHVLVLFNIKLQL